jgi:hypothetical protein
MYIDNRNALQGTIAIAHIKINLSCIEVITERNYSMANQTQWRTTLSNRLVMATEL